MADLMAYETGEFLREATEGERMESQEAAGLDGGCGVFRVEGVRVFVEES
jgi:hypothetical protein